jgi:peptidoglycan/LPS O-acetylase OafA/YrhL
VPKTLRSLTGLRALAAGVVFLTHVQYIFNGNPLSRPTYRLFVQGKVGVSFFFILSGFVLTWSWRPGLSRFYRRRFARIYPAYLTSLALAGVVLWLIGGTATRTEIVASIFMVQSWFTSHAIWPGVNAVTWSLSCEAFFYLLFPLLIVVALRASSRMRQVTLAASILLAIVVATWLSPLMSSVNKQMWLTDVFPPVRLLEFVAGVLLALEVKARRWPRIPLSVAWPLVLVAYLAAGEAGLWHRNTFTIYESYAAVTFLPFVILIGAYATRDLEGRPTRFGSPMAVRLGEISYAFYLVHFLVIELFRHYTSDWQPNAPVSLIATSALLLAAFAGAAALYYLVERPAEKLLRPDRLRPEAVPLTPELARDSLEAEPRPPASRVDGGPPAVGPCAPTADPAQRGVSVGAPRFELGTSSPPD